MIAATGAAMVIAALAFILLDYREGWWPGRPDESAETVLDLGIAYLPVTRGLSSYYHLGTDFGALVTSVTAGSAADRAGIKPGDVIVSFNGSSLEGQVSLLGLIRSCQSGTSVEMEVSRAESTRLVRFAH